MRPGFTVGGFCEPTATVVWTTMGDLGVSADRFVLWNTYPFHPHKPGQPLTNRPPTDDEAASHAEVLATFLALFPGRRIVPIGETAGARLVRHTAATSTVRHPANGGVPDFRASLRAIIRPLTSRNRPNDGTR